MPKSCFVTYKNSALTQEDLDEEIQDVASDVDEFEFSLIQARRARTQHGKGGVRALRKGKRGAIRFQKSSGSGVDDSDDENEAISFSIDYEKVILPVTTLVRLKPDTLKLYNEVEADFTGVNEQEDITQKLDALNTLQEQAGINVSVRAPVGALESYKMRPFPLTVELAEVNQQTVDDVVARGNNCVNNLVYIGENPVPPVIEKSYENLATVVKDEMKPIGDVDRIYSELESLQEKYDEAAARGIQEKIDAIQYSPNIALFFVTKLNFIKDYVSYKIKGSQYELAYLEHKITMMSRANDVANFDLKIRTETDDEKRKQLSKAKSIYELESSNIFSELDGAMKKVANGISEEDLIIAESSVDELLRTYKLLTVLYYNSFDEFNVLKTQKDKNLSVVRENMAALKDKFKRDTKDPELKANLRNMKQRFFQQIGVV
jgi:hypothetical protein